MSFAPKPGNVRLLIFYNKISIRSAGNILLTVKKQGGIILIAHFDWIPLAGNLVAATEELISRHNPDWKMSGGSRLYPLWLRDLGAAGFRQIETFFYDLFVPYTHADWRGRIRASAAVGAILAPAQAAVFDAELDVMLRKYYPEPVLQVHHRVFAVIARPPLE